jgi:hypothetical protein
MKNKDKEKMEKEFNLNTYQYGSESCNGKANEKKSRKDKKWRF